MSRGILQRDIKKKKNKEEEEKKKTPSRHPSGTFISVIFI